MAEVYAGCFELLRPGGILVTITKHSRRGDRTLDKKKKKKNPEKKRKKKKT
jgi:predicted methyltransferase